MEVWKLSILTALVIVPDWRATSFATCYPTYAMVIETPSGIIICDTCRPGFETSPLCLDHFNKKSYKLMGWQQIKYLYSNSAITFSDCVWCKNGTFSKTSLKIQTCDKCSYCRLGYVVKKICSATSDTDCRPYLSHTVRLWPTSLSGITNSTLKSGISDLPAPSRAVNLYMILFPVILIFAITTLTSVAFAVVWRKRMNRFVVNGTKQNRGTFSSRKDYTICNNAGATNTINDGTIPDQMIEESSKAPSQNGSVHESTDDEPQGITLHASKTFDHEGGPLEIVGSSVSVKVPKGAINEGEIKDIDVKIKLSKPNDWKSLRDSGYTTALPHIELGPSGSKFNKPVEVLMKSSAPYDIEDDVTFEFTEGHMNEKSEWLPAVKCNSRKEAKSMALARSPHVAFVVTERALFAYYLHFTGGRLKKKIPKKKWFQSSAFVKTNTITGERLAIKAVLYEGGEDERTLLYKQLEEFREVSVSAQPILVCREELDSVETVIHDIAETWALRQGDSIQKIPISCSFDPKYVGCFPSVDYVLCNGGSGVTDFECIIDVKNGNKKNHELKVNIDRDPLRRLWSALQIKQKLRVKIECEKIADLIWN